MALGCPPVRVSLFCVRDTIRADESAGSWPTKKPPTEDDCKWETIVKKAIERSASQNNGKPAFARACPEIQKWSASFAPKSRRHAVCCPQPCQAHLCKVGLRTLQK